MILDLDSIFNTVGLSKEFDYEMSLSEEVIGIEKPFTKPVHISGKVSNHTGIVEIDAVAEFVLETSCDRCARDIHPELSVKINHTLVTHLNDEDNDDFLLVNELRFNLDELVTEDIFLELPSKFLCSEECKGVCAKCGKNLNDGPCDCKKEIDPRLAALQQLLDE